MLLFAKMLQINANSNAFLFYAMAILLLFYQALCHIGRGLHYGLPSASPRGGRLLIDFFLVMVHHRDSEDLTLHQAVFCNIVLDQMTKPYLRLVD